MNQSQIKKINKIYSNSISINVFELLIRSLSTIESQFQNKIKIIVKGYPNDYFSVVEIIKPKPVLFAGAMEENKKNGELLPSMRFRKRNEYLHHVPLDLLFESTLERKEEWKWVILHERSIGIIPDLMGWEIQNRFGSL